MKNIILISLGFIILAIASCAPDTWRYHDLRGYHYGKGNGYNGKYRGKHHHYGWERGNRAMDKYH